MTTYIIIQLAFGLLAALIWAFVRRKPPLCDGCRHLQRKGGGVMQYDCRQRRSGGFDRAPSICADYEEKRERN